MIKFASKHEDNEIKKRLKEISYWNYPFQIGNVIAESHHDQNDIEFKLRSIPTDLTGKNFLDIGTNEGYFSFVAEQRGANRILAIDNVVQSGWGPDKNFKAVKELIGSKCEFRELSVYDLDAINEKFDVVFFMDVYYHLENPLLALRKIFPKVKDFLLFGGYVLEDKFLRVENDKPVMYLFRPRELNPLDNTNVWGATLGCMQRMLELTGFKNIELIEKYNSRAIFKAYV